MVTLTRGCWLGGFSFLWDHQDVTYRSTKMRGNDARMRRFGDNISIDLEICVFMITIYDTWISGQPRSKTFGAKITSLWHAFAKESRRRYLGGLHRRIYRLRIDNLNQPLNTTMSFKIRERFVHTVNNPLGMRMRSRN